MMRNIVLVDLVRDSVSARILFYRKYLDVHLVLT